MFSKESIAKTKTTYNKKSCKTETLTIVIQLNANHNIPQNILDDLERNLKNINISEYSIVKEIKK